MKSKVLSLVPRDKTSFMKAIQGFYGVVKVQLFDPSAVIVQYFDASAVFLFPLQL